MTATELAALLNGREYGNEMTRKEEDAAKAAGLVVVFGASDDLMELRGAIRDEFGCWGGGTAYLTANGLFKSKCDDEDCPYAEAEKVKGRTIEAVWGTSAPWWSYETDIPHETFDIMENGKPYCRGIVFALAELGAA